MISRLVSERSLSGRSEWRTADSFVAESFGYLKLEASFGSVAGVVFNSTDVLQQLAHILSGIMLRLFPNRMR